MKAVYGAYSGVFSWIWNIGKAGNWIGNGGWQMSCTVRCKPARPQSVFENGRDGWNMKDFCWKKKKKKRKLTKMCRHLPSNYTAPNRQYFSISQYLPVYFQIRQQPIRAANKSGWISGTFEPDLVQLNIFKTFYFIQHNSCVLLLSSTSRKKFFTPPPISRFRSLSSSRFHSQWLESTHCWRTTLG